MKRMLVIAVLVLLVAVMLAGCAPGANDQVNTPDTSGQVAGFWLGVWHGIISPVTFIISLFNHHMTIYEVHNNGGWYNFGFLVGLSVILGGGGGGGAAAARRGR